MEAVKSIIPTLILDCAVPTIDQISDLMLIIRWYVTGHDKFASAMALPFLMNAISNIYHWMKWDSKEEKKFTWLLVILQLWPVYRALKIIYHIYKKAPNIEQEREKIWKRNCKS